MAHDPPGTKRLEVREYVDADSQATLTVFRAAVHGTASRDHTREQVDARAPEDIDVVSFARRRRAARSGTSTCTST